MEPPTNHPETNGPTILWRILRGLWSVTAVPAVQVGPDGLTRNQRDAVRILHELILAGTPLVTFCELAAELDTELDAARTLVEELQFLGWVHVPPDTQAPFLVLREPDMSLGGWEAWWQ